MAELSANEFTLFLARVLCKEKNDQLCKKSTITTLSELSSISKHKHRKDIDKHFPTYKEYSDDSLSL